MRRATPAFAVRYALVGALLVTWALGIGRYGGPDEPAHVLRSFAAAHGNVLGDPADPLPPGYRVVGVPAALASGDPSCYRHDARITSQCASPSIAELGAADDDDRVDVATSAGLTPPVYHVAIGSLVRLIGDPSDTSWYRLMAALVHAIVLALTLTRLRYRPLGAVTAIVLLTPATWFLLGVVNPNSLEVALAVLAWVGVAKFVDEPVPTASDAWWIAAPMAISIAVRPIAIVTAVAMALIIELRGRGARRWILATPVALAAAAVVGWHLAVDVQIDDPRTAVDRSTLSSLGESIGSLPTTASEAVRSLGWNEFQAPLPAAVAWTAASLWLAVVAVVVARRLQSSPRLLLAAGAWIAMLVATPVVFETAMAGSVGPIWQGRYSLPVLLGLAAFVRVPPVGRRSLVAVVVVIALIEVATYWTTIRRYAVGSDGSWWLDDAFRSTAWLSPRAWLALHLGLVLIAAVAIVRSTGADGAADGSVDVAEHVDDDVGRARVVVDVE